MEYIFKEYFKVSIWTYDGKDILSHNDLPEETTDIVYRINYTDNTSYIGKKTIRADRRLKPTKEQLAIRKNYKRVESKLLPFKDYIGSSKENDGKDIRNKVILFCCSNKRTATYLESKLLFMHNVLENDIFNNKNILGSFYGNCLDGLINNSKDK
jgi:hypothetical protein